MQISATTPNPSAPAEAPQAAPVAEVPATPAAPAAAPLVTVSLSPEARAAQTALSAMPMADAVKQLTPGAQGQGPLAQAKALLLKLADGSGVAKAEQVQAYTALQKLVFMDPDRTWFKESTADDRKAYAAIMDGGETSTQIRKAADDFNRWSMSQDMRSNVPRKKLAHLNALSPLEQQMVFAGTASADGTVDQGATSLDQWKAQMQDDIVFADKLIALDEAEKKTGKAGKTAAAGKGAAKDVAKDGEAAANEDSPAEQALAALASPGQGDGVAAAALKMLQKAAAARAEAKEQADKAREQEARDEPRSILEPYVIGDRVDKTV